MTYAPRVRLGLKIAAGLALAYCGWVFTDRYMTNSRWVRQVARSQAAARNPEFDRIYGGSSVKILSFYARDGDLLEGDRTVLCYGVLNARAVRIAPWVGEVTPSLSRCRNKNSRGRDAAHTAPPAQIRACAANALDSCLGCSTSKR